PKRSDIDATEFEGCSDLPRVSSKSQPENFCPRFKNSFSAKSKSLHNCSGLAARRRDRLGPQFFADTPPRVLQGTTAIPYVSDGCVGRAAHGPRFAPRGGCRDDTDDTAPYKTFRFCILGHFSIS